MFEIAISPRSRWLVPATRYDIAVGYRFEDRERAEQFCQELNHFCYQERFLVIRVVPPVWRSEALRPAMKVAA